MYMVKHLMFMVSWIGWVDVWVSLKKKKICIWHKWCAKRMLCSSFMLFQQFFFSRDTTMYYSMFDFWCWIHMNVFMLGITGIESESGTTSIFCVYFPIGASNVLQAFGYFKCFLFTIFVFVFEKDRKYWQLLTSRTLLYLECHELYYVL